MLTVKDFWREFLGATGRDLSLKCPGDWCFEFPDENVTNYLISLILQGKKKATTSCLASYEIDKSPLPKIGDYHILTDLTGNPLCILITTNVLIMPFKDMTFDICKREGKDQTLESWQNRHREFFIGEGQEMGYEFEDDSLIVFEDFEIVYQKR